MQDEYITQALIRWSGKGEKEHFRKKVKLIYI